MARSDFLFLVLKMNGIDCEPRCPLSSFSTFRIGGTADLAVFPKSTEQLAVALRLLHDARIPFDIVGNGSNILFPDGRYKGAIIFTKNMKTVTFHDANHLVGVSAGVPLPFLAVEAQKRGLSGLEFACGIPGTVGGAIFMNAGAFGSCMADVTFSALWYDFETEEFGTFKKDKLCFGQRTSIFEQNDRYVILEAYLCLQAGYREKIQAKMDEYRQKRRDTQPLDLPSAGSVFRHPVGAYAGKLIEDCGLKGTRIGGAEVSQKHAGFIVNRGNATAKDVTDLIELIKKVVFEKTGYRLECEIRTVGYRGNKQEE